MNNLTGNHGASGAGGAAGGEKKDYVDKGFDMLSKKSGHNVDPKTGEKITDSARGLFEKATGYVFGLQPLRSPFIWQMANMWFLPPQ